MFYDHNSTKLEVNDKNNAYFNKYCRRCRDKEECTLNNKYLELNINKKYQNLWDNAMLTQRGKFRDLMFMLEKQDMKNKQKCN